MFRNFWFLREMARRILMISPSKLASVSWEMAQKIHMGTWQQYPTCEMPLMFVILEMHSILFHHMRDTFPCYGNMITISNMWNASYVCDPWDTLHSSITWRCIPLLRKWTFDPLNSSSYLKSLELSKIM